MNAIESAVTIKQIDDETLITVEPRYPHEYEHVGIQTRIKHQAAQAEYWSSVDPIVAIEHALDVIRLSASGNKLTPECNRAMAILINLGHWTTKTAIQ